MTEELEKVGEINIKDMIYEVRGKQVMSNLDISVMQCYSFILEKGFYYE